MEMDMLDEAWGWESDSSFCLEQVWLLGDEDVARVTVKYNNNGIGYSHSKVEVGDITPEAETPLLTLRTFPSQWWGNVVFEEEGDSVPEVIVAVADGLMVRAASVLDRFAEVLALNAEQGEYEEL